MKLLVDQQFQKYSTTNNHAKFIVTKTTIPSYSDAKFESKQIVLTKFTCVCVYMCVRNGELHITLYAARCCGIFIENALNS